MGTGVFGNLLPICHLGCHRFRVCLATCANKKSPQALFFIMQGRNYFPRCHPAWKPKRLFEFFIIGFPLYLFEIAIKFAIYNIAFDCSNVFHWFRLTLKGFQPVTLFLFLVTSKSFHCTSAIIILFLINTILHSICGFVKFYAKMKFLCIIFKRLYLYGKI